MSNQNFRTIGNCRIGGANRSAGGFTLIELIVVIVILGILSATALPRFIDLSSDAHRAKVAAVAGAFSAAASLAHAAWASKGHTSYIANLAGYMDGSVDFNASGYPVETIFTPAMTLPELIDSSSCVSIWRAILNTSDSIGTAASGNNWQATGNAGAQTCTYTYLTDTSATRRFVYSANTGAVAISSNP